MDYSTLVNCITSNDILSKAVQDMQARTYALNLITPEWKTDLENSAVYKLHLDGKAKYHVGKACAKEKAYNKKLKFPNQMYTIIIAGEWSLSKTEEDEYSIVSRDCEPLKQIALSMRENTDSNLHDGGRFFIRECNPQFCASCRSQLKKYEIPFVGKNWCVKSLRIFDGQQINMTFSQNFQNNLTQNFLGILRMQITSRTTYGENCYKIGGMIEELIVFQHSVLIPSSLLCLESTGNQPCVEYPDEEVKLPE